MRAPSLDIAGKSDPGRVRENNEDSFAFDPALGLLVVADGMGGHNSGEVASRLATETILDLGRKTLGGAAPPLPVGGDPARSARARQLEHLLRTANAVIFEKAAVSPQNHGMGTTVVAAIVAGKTATVAHVGDSRFYLLRRGALRTLTADHSLLAEQVRMGLLTAEEGERSGLQNVLVRALGIEPGVDVDVEDHPVSPGDVLLLCSDGLTKMVSDADIARTLEQAPDAHAACDRLVELARAAGGIDNITVIVARMPRAADRIRGALRRIFQLPQR